MDKKKYYTQFIIGKVKGTFRKRESPHSESKYHSVKISVIKNAFWSNIGRD